MKTSKRKTKKTWYLVRLFGLYDWAVEVWIDNVFHGWLQRQDGLIRIFSTTNGARKAIWRERNHEYHL